MERIEALDTLRARVADWRRSGQRIAFVPTMGNLHAGHIALVTEARGQADRVVASIFVNPLQFGPGEDFGAYPRTLERDRAMLDDAHCDLLFAPGVETMYPTGQQGQTRVEVPGLSDLLCGASRPGHFTGVATVVCKLFNMVQPDVALFGEKDLQQLLVIRRMTADLSLPVEIVGVSTVREPDGLALSSRNGYLTPAERSAAPGLYGALRLAADALRSGESVARAEALGAAAVGEAGLRLDYLSIRDPETLTPPAPEARDLVVLAAAHLGRARLIDNLRVGLTPGPRT
jgi:pantoate--beta-alanine ligase